MKGEAEVAGNAQRPEGRSGSLGQTASTCLVNALIVQVKFTSHLRYRITGTYRHVVMGIPRCL